MTISANHLFSFLIALCFAMGCSSTSSKTIFETSPPTTENTESIGKLVANPVSTPTIAETSPFEISGCKLDWKREAKIKALNTAVKKSDLETESVKDGFTNSAQRNRLAILSAGIIPNDVPFVSVDRRCWSEFYRAHQQLLAGKEALAKKTAEGWRICLLANFQDRSKQAQALYRCFGLSSIADLDGPNKDSEN